MEQVRLFVDKLKARKQSDLQCRQAAYAVAVFLGLQKENVLSLQVSHESPDEKQGASVGNNRVGKKKGLPIGSPFWVAKLIFLGQGRMGRGQPGNGDPEWGAGDVVQPHVVAEDDGCGVPAMLAADPQFDLFPRGATQFAGHLDQLAYAALVQAYERVLREQVVFNIKWEKTACIVP